MFKESFKYYKSRNPPPDYKDVIDFENPNLAKVTNISGYLETEQFEYGLVPSKDWNIYEFLDTPGLRFIQNPFTAHGQQYWITNCLKAYSQKPYKINLDAHGILKDNETWWDLSFRDTRSKTILPKLRWATLGYHHDWDTKHYCEHSKSPVPDELSTLTITVARVLGFPEFKPEAAIVNYYRMNSTLAGHTDHSEPNVEAPLFSISFGQTAIFLIGGSTQDDSANAMFLRSGDILVMSGESRLRYHGVPRIIPTRTSPWDNTDGIEDIKLAQNNIDWDNAKLYIGDARININVRQVLKLGQTSL